MNPVFGRVVIEREEYIDFVGNLLLWATWPRRRVSNAFTAARAWSLSSAGHLCPTRQRRERKLRSKESLLGVAAQRAARRAVNGSRVDFKVLRITPEGTSSRTTLANLMLHIGPRDEGEPVITIMCPNGDGDGAQALIALERAQAIAPNYSMASLIGTMLENVLNPETWDGFDPEGLA